MTNPVDTPIAPEGWLDSLVISKAQIADGQRVELAPILERLRATTERLEATQGVLHAGEQVSADR